MGGLTITQTRARPRAAGRNRAKTLRPDENQSAGTHTFLQRVIGLLQPRPAEKTAAPTPVHRGPLRQAAHNGDLDGVRTLLRQGTRVNDDRDGTALHDAAANGHSDIVKLLLMHGAQVNARDTAGDSPLHAAAFNHWGHGRQESIVRLLLQQGAKVNSRNGRGWTPLHTCALTGDAQVAKLLLSYHANVNARTVEGWTPLHIAKRDKREDMVALLRKRNAR